MPKVTINHADTPQKVFYTDNRVRNQNPAYVFVHGAGGTHLHWPAELRQIETAAAFTPDLPGHGKSELPGENSVEAYAKVIGAFVDALREKDDSIEQIVLVGHSMGGAVVQTIALDAPPWLAGLVLVGTSARLRVSDKILDGLLTDFPKTVGFIMKLCWAAPIVPPVRIALAGREMKEIAPEVVHGDFSACNHFDLREHVHEIGVPTLVIGASDDLMTPLKHNQFLAEQISNARFERIDQAGHMMALEYPLEVTAAIQKFAEQFTVS